MKRGSMIKNLGDKLRNELASDYFYRRCCISGDTEQIEWHHAFRFRGERINEKWCIVPLTKKLHAKADTRKIKDIVDWIILNRADYNTLVKYSKAENLITKRDRLNERFGVWYYNKYLERSSN